MHSMNTFAVYPAATEMMCHFSSGFNINMMWSKTGIWNPLYHIGEASC